MLSSSSESEPGDFDVEDTSGVKGEVKEEADDDQPEHLTSSSWRTAPAEDKPKELPVEAGDPWLPVRVKQALEKSETFADFKKNRQFIYVHLFAGHEDVLGAAIVRLATLDGMNVEVRSFDKESTAYAVDLAEEQPFHDILDAARGGLIDGSHSGFPCGSFSRARYNEGHGPPPVRSLQFIYGLPSNGERQQREADRGSLLAIRSTQVTAEVAQSQRLRMVPECATMENPPGSEGQAEGPAWRLPEVESFLQDFRCEKAVYNTCAFQANERVKWFKPGQWAGCLQGLPSLSRKCTCPKFFKHEGLVGKEKTARAAKYPNQLALEVGKLIIKAFRTTLNLEWWRYQEKLKKVKLQEAKSEWLAAKEKGKFGKPIEVDKMKELRGSKRAWDAGDISRDVLPTPSKVSKKQAREEENARCLGGMRNPASALKRMTVMQEAGNDVARLWRNLVMDMPEALDAARSCGTDRCQLDPGVLQEWEHRLRLLMKVAKEPEVKLKGRFQFESPLKPEWWEAWQKFSKDPETDLATWFRRGAPLGMGAPIPKSNGIFPAVHGEAEVTELSSLESQMGTHNYQSVYENKEAAEGELQRLLDKGFAKRLSAEEAKTMYGSGTVSRLALISKMKDSGQMKHRLVIDLLRSGGNALAAIPERIVLPRVCDVVKGIQALWRTHGGQAQEDDWALELVGADLRDAYCHLAVDEAEHRHCLAPTLKEGEWVLFVSMLFGFRGAPLIMGRLAGAMSRQWQAAMEDKAMLQCYMDDPVLIVAGDRKTRDSLVSRMLYLAEVFGIQLAYEKGERGSKICWIGVSLEIDMEGKAILVSVPQKLIDEVLQKLGTWAGMVSTKEFKSLTGKLSWIAGTLTRTRWAVSAFYGALTDSEREEALNVEEARAAKREHDQRSKKGLIAVKRVELAKRWIEAYLQQEECWRCRKIPLQVDPPKWAVTTDASPFGVGAILSVVDKDMGELTPTIAIRGKVTKNVAQVLGISFREASGQAVLEAWTVLLLEGHTEKWECEMSLLMDSIQMQEVVAHHLPGKLNVEADYLSRPDIQGPPPGRLRDISIRQLNEAWMLETALPPPGVEPALWGRNPGLSSVFDCL
eukprot:s1794_g27.t1